MDEITHISVFTDPDCTGPAKTRAFYVDRPETDPLDEEPFGSGRHRIEQLRDGGSIEGEKRSTTLWSWSLPQPRRGA